MNEVAACDKYFELQSITKIAHIFAFILIKLVAGVKDAIKLGDKGDQEQRFWTLIHLRIVESLELCGNYTHDQILWIFVEVIADIERASGHDLEIIIEL